MKKYHIFFTIIVSFLSSCVGKYSTENYVQTEIFDEFNGGLYISGVSTYYGIDAIDYKLKELGFNVEHLSSDYKLYELKNPSIETLRILTYNVFDEEIYQATKVFYMKFNILRHKGIYSL